MKNEKIKFIASLHAAKERVRNWPKWKKVMFERSVYAELYFKEQNEK